MGNQQKVNPKNSLHAYLHQRDRIDKNQRNNKKAKALQDFMKSQQNSMRTMSSVWGGSRTHKKSRHHKKSKKSKKSKRSKKH